jgi:hypothetical protein
VLKEPGYNGASSDSQFRYGRSYRAYDERGRVRAEGGQNAENKSSRSQEIIGGMSATGLVTDYWRIGKEVGFLDLDTTLHN